MKQYYLELHDFNNKKLKSYDSRDIHWRPIICDSLIQRYVFMRGFKYYPSNLWKYSGVQKNENCWEHGTSSFFFFGVCLFSESVCDYCIYFILGHKILEANLQKGRTTFIRYEYNKYRSQNDSSSILYTEHGDVNTSVIMIYRNNAEKSIIIQFVHVLSQWFTGIMLKSP
jgi:hypothetical protein